MLGEKISVRRFVLNLSGFPPGCFYFLKKSVRICVRGLRAPLPYFPGPDNQKVARTSRWARAVESELEKCMGLAPCRLINHRPANKFEELSCPSQASATLIKRLSSQLHTLSARTNKMNFLSSDVPDPTDFSSSAPGLRSLDASLRCTICGDLFDAPVTLPCGHCFCSAVRVLILYSNLIFE